MPKTTSRKPPIPGERTKTIGQDMTWFILRRMSIIWIIINPKLIIKNNLGAVEPFPSSSSMTEKIMAKTTNVKAQNAGNKTYINGHVIT